MPVFLVAVVFGEADDTDVINGGGTVRLRPVRGVCADVFGVVVPVEQGAWGYFVDDRPEEDTVHSARCLYPRFGFVAEAPQWGVDACGCVVGEHEVYPVPLLLECQGVGDSGFYVNAGDVFVGEPVFPGCPVLPVDASCPAEPEAVCAAEVENGSAHDADNVGAELLEPVFYNRVVAVGVEGFVITVYEKHHDTLFGQEVVEFGELTGAGDEPKIAELDNSVGAEPLTHVDGLVLDPTVVAMPVTRDNRFGGIFEVFPNVFHIPYYTK